MKIMKLFSMPYQRVISTKFISTKELKRLKSMGRYTPTQTVFCGNNLKIVDACTFMSSFDEIFIKGIYKFDIYSDKITIIDCGANIGLSTIYFKKNYPSAEIVAFEPDPYIFKALKDNILSQGFLDVALRNEAVSNRDGISDFYMEGGHSGMIVKNNLNEKVTQVKSVRLKSILQQFDEITFLKIDIEGHESKVIPDIADELRKVKYLFLEYHSFIYEPQILGDLLNIISNAGLKYYIQESYRKPFPFISKEIFLKMDLLLNIFCYRED